MLCPTECWSSAWGICRTGSPSPRAEPERPCVGVKQAKLGNMECCGVKTSVPRLEGTESVVPNSAGGIVLMHLLPVKISLLEVPESRTFSASAEEVNVNMKAGISRAPCKLHT